METYITKSDRLGNWRAGRVVYLDGQLLGGNGGEAPRKPNEDPRFNAGNDNKKPFGKWMGRLDFRSG